MSCANSPSVLTPSMPRTAICSPFERSTPSGAATYPRARRVGRAARTTAPRFRVVRAASLASEFQTTTLTTSLSLARAATLLPATPSTTSHHSEPTLNSSRKPISSRPPRLRLHCKRVSQKFGITRLPETANFPGWTFPWSCPFDLMHLLENTCKNMALLIFGSFKGMDAGRESYILPENIVKEIGRLTLTANKTVPSTFGRSIPNPAEERNFFTAEAWVTWTTLYAPVLLRNRFARPKYYKHFMLFVSIVTRVMRPKSSKAQRDTLRADIKKWYAQVEQYIRRLLPSAHDTYTRRLGSSIRSALPASKSASASSTHGCTS